MKNEFYMDMISRSIISSLSDEIAGKIKKEIKGYVEEAVEKSMAGQTAAIDASLNVMKKELSAAGETGEIVASSGKEIKDRISEVEKAVEKNMAGQTAEINDAIKEIKKELSETGEIKAVVEASGQELKEQISEIKKEMSEAGEIRTIVESSGHEIKAHISEMGKALKENDQNETLLKEELTDIKQMINANKKEQSELLNVTIDKTLTGQNEKISSYIEDMKSGLNQTVEIKKIIADSNKEIKKHIKDMESGLQSGDDLNEKVKAELAGMKQTLTENKKEDKELLNGVYYSVKKLLADDSREKASTQFENALARIKEQIKENTEKHLRIENTSQDKIAGEFNAGINDLKKYIDKKIEKSFKEQGQQNEVHNELTKINKALDEKAKLLNGVVYSVKKLTSARTKEKEGAEDMMAQFRVILDALNRHVHLLEADKDELSVELLRLAGDEFFQSKFAELEEKLKKTKNLADKYLTEKIELASKLEAFQHLWEQSAENEG